MHPKRFECDPRYFLQQPPWRIVPGGHALGHRDVRVMDGGRDKWLAEGRPTETAPPAVAPTEYPVAGLDWSARARLADVQAATGAPHPVPALPGGLCCIG